MNDTILQFIILAPPLLLALTVHEFAHGYVAFRLGDPTARALGRLTLNPIKHLDPLGTIAFFIFHIGWAKPVPVNPSYFKNPQKDMLWVALAGPATNLIMAIISALMTKALWLLAQIIPYSAMAEAVLIPLNSTLIASVWINLVLCIFNFLPIPPLDGSRILAGILPPDLARSYASIERYGFILLIILAATGVLSKLIIPLINFANSLLLS
ncbi:MAG: site-2 protease family protein [Proteobacteria bacterium]|nr:site-2 protease family protein [Pseudomonadota bacterium]MCG2744564.1 site-2 protease family protein [Desulfobacteraceae bacterium]MDO8948178.1 site-2 protease family protein [Desulfocapsaceae bacterium]MBU3983424.1 site-2 protease family protein [Pseudomonadota bacterium]MBU4027637.1 site-2 protease family protein [Pseudomonadota bacterium]